MSCAGPWAVDIGVALLIQAAVTIPFVVPRGPGLPPADWPSYGLTTLAVLPLVWRRRAPVTVLLAVVVAQILYKFTLDGPGQTLPYTSLMALYTVAALSPARRRVPSAVLTFALVPPGVAVNSGEARHRPRRRGATGRTRRSAPRRRDRRAGQGRRRRQLARQRGRPRSARRPARRRGPPPCPGTARSARHVLSRRRSAYQGAAQPRLPVVPPARRWLRRWLRTA
ncbi:putative two-component system sensor kinase [Streptomyces sp. L-9-10]|nr:putative two-component system sensor kinase [Streptomyces sp. L-9-10]